MDVSAWLRSIGLEKYETAFRDHAVEADVLPKLTSDDLRDISVAAVGDRRRFLEAIAALSAAPQSEETPLTTERRQLTVMFVDLVGSTALSARLDPEDMRAIIADYHKRVAAAVTSAGGYVAKYMGDGVLAYFGYPRAQEDDAERAVHAGLAIAESAKGLQSPTGEALHIRVGVATGVVVVGDLIGSGESSERGVVGDTPNLAARLQSVAEPDQLVIAEGTRRLIGDLFELRDLGALDLKGIAGRPRAYTVMGARSVESRFEALRGGALPNLVGREQERDLLMQLWAKAKAGQGQVVLISGEPGIGKSRLTADLLAHVAEEPHVRMRYYCSPQTVDSALQPLVAQMERAAGLLRGDEACVRLDKLDALLGRTATPPEERGLIADMLGLADDGRYPPLEAQASVRRKKLLAALAGQIERLSHEKAVLLVFEDAHWADSSSLEAIGELFRRIGGLRGLALVTFRPEFAPPWTGQAHVTSLVLHRLPPADIQALIDSMAGGAALPDRLRRDIVERADGVPLFAEEIAKAVMEAAGEAATRVVSSLPSPERNVPPSLHAPLLARLDRLGAAKEIAQVGAAIGRSFAVELLESVTGKPEAELGVSLQRLVDAGLLFRQGAPREEYIFKHALIQDAAYVALLREPRRNLHARIAAALERLTPNIATSRPEVLAHHCVEAGNILRGAWLWGEAGKLACAKSATVEGEVMLRRALRLIAGLPNTANKRKDEIDFQIALMNAMFITHGWGAVATQEATARAQWLIGQAEALGDRIENPLALFAILYGAWMRYRVEFDGKQIVALGQEFLSNAERSKSPQAIAFGRALRGTAMVETGEIEASKALLKQAIRELTNIDSAVYLNVFNLDMLSYARIPYSYAAYLSGHQDESARGVVAAVDSCRGLNHIATLFVNIWCSIPMHCLLGSDGVIISQLNEMVTLADKLQIPQSQQHKLLEAFVSLKNGQISKVPDLLVQAREHRHAFNMTVMDSFFTAMLAEVYLQLGDCGSARVWLRKSMDHIEQRCERWFEADVHRLSGEIARAERNEREAEACFERAFAVARSQKARSLELRAATSFAHMRRDQGRQVEARDLLQPIYNWFTEGFDKPDLRAARELLEGLA